MIRIVSSHKALLGPVILLLSLTACGHKEKITGQAPVRVEIRCVDLSHGGDTTVYSGTVEPATTSPIGFKVAGTITSLSVGEGDRVVRGQVLGHLSSGDYANASNIAEAELAQARDAYARLKKLHDADALPEIKWVEVQNKLKQAENAAEISRRALDDATLVSPVSGYVGRKFASVGQSVVPAEPVYELVSADDVQMAISVPESEIGAISEGAGAELSFPAIGVRGLEGKVVSRSVVADPLTRAYTVKLSLPADSRGILPGMVGEARLGIGKSGSAQTGVVLPSQAVLLSFDNRNFVWVVSDGKAERRFVTADELASDGVRVTSGLSVGDSVIVAGMQKVGTGTSVFAAE